MSREKRNLSFQKIFQAIPIITGLLTAFAWGRAGYIGWTLLGSVVALFITRRVVKGLTKATHWISVIFGFLLLSFGSQLKLLDHLGRSSLPKVQLLWILTFLLSLVMLTVLRACRRACEHHVRGRLRPLQPRFFPEFVQFNLGAQAPDLRLDRFLPYEAL